MPDHSPSTDERASLAQLSQSSSPLEGTSHLGFSLGEVPLSIAQDVVGGQFLTRAGRDCVQIWLQSRVGYHLSLHGSFTTDIWRPELSIVSNAIPTLLCLGALCPRTRQRVNRCQSGFGNCK